MPRLPLFAIGLLALLAGAGPLHARTTIAAYGSWAAFRDAGPLCYAIAQPAEAPPAGGGASVAVAWWPGRGIARQLHVRLSRAARPASRVTLSIGDSNFALVARGADAWAADARADAGIAAAMHSGSSMSVSAVGAGGGFADVYLLRGAASAIDAAQLGCIGR